MDEIQALREEIAKLRERVAVLESKRGDGHLGVIRQPLTTHFPNTAAPQVIPPYFVSGAIRPDEPTCKGN